MAKIIERFEMQSLENISEIKTTILPIMRGQTNKDRINLIKSFINAVQKIDKDTGDQTQQQQTCELLRSFVIELISAINNSNQKVRLGAQEAFLSMA